MTHSESTKQRAQRSPDAQAKKRAQRSTRGAKNQGGATRPVDKNRRSSRPDPARDKATRARSKARKTGDKTPARGNKLESSMCRTDNGRFLNPPTSAIIFRNRMLKFNANHVSVYSDD